VKIYRLRLRNDSGQQRRLAVTYCAELVLGSVAKINKYTYAPRMTMSPAPSWRRSTGMVATPGIRICGGESAREFAFRRSRRVSWTQQHFAEAGRDGTYATG